MYQQKQQLRDSYILHIYTCYKNILYTHTMFWYMVQLTLNARLYTHELFLRNLSTCMLAYLIKACVYIYIYTHVCAHALYVDLDNTHAKLTSCTCIQTYLSKKMQEPGGQHQLPHAASCTLAPCLYLEASELIHNILDI